MAAVSPPVFTHAPASPARMMLCSSKHRVHLEYTHTKIGTPALVVAARGVAAVARSTRHQLSRRGTQLHRCQGTHSPGVRALHEHVDDAHDPQPCLGRNSNSKSLS
eukprot:TRINITY_DN441_c0_g2_i1.p2 TRINITY_DN441_c0_g2~~TRINITY_DN441_c0_g2_i1.p2  ORF type:complete len:106 (+),score=3.38 TRINITY_DN441_c0_g2_i1:204-521(+)